MTHGSLFSGIGGFDLAAEWAGWENKFHCEWNEFGQKVLKYYWPNATSYGDITKTDFTIWRGKIDVLTGGFPCQPYSTAGKRLGKEDERHLWPEMLRAIREIQPRYVVGENVPGLINWNGGMVFDEVQADLEASGYEVIPFILPAASVNAPHRRERVWFVAYCDCAGLQEAWPEQQTAGASGSSLQGTVAHSRSNGFNWSNSQHEINASKGGFNALSDTRESIVDGADTNTSSTGLQGQPISGSTRKIGKESNEQPARFFRTDWEVFPTVSPIHERNDGISDRLSGITFPKWRAEAVKACGNAIVPQVVYQIFKAINDYENQ